MIMFLFILQSILANSTNMANIDAQFEAFCNFGATADKKKKNINDKNVKKLFKDCGLYGKSLTATDTDIAFSKHKAKSSKYVLIYF